MNETLKPLSLSRKFSIRKTSEAQELSAEIYEYFGKQEPFMTFRGIVKMKGVKAVREIFEIVKKCDFTHKLPLLLKECSKIKVIWKSGENSVIYNLTK